MKRLNVGFALGLALALPLTAPLAPAHAAATQSALPDPEPARLALAEDIVTIAFPPSEREAMMHKLITAMTAQFSASVDLSSIKDEGARSIVTGYLNSIPERMRPLVNDFLPKQMAVVARAYARMYSERELTDVLAFARTPSGATFLQHSMDVMSDPEVAAANTAYFKDVQIESQKIGTEITQDLMAYAKEHPEAFPDQSK